MSGKKGFLKDVFQGGQTFSEFVEYVGSKGSAFQRAYRDTDWPTEIVDRFRRTAATAGGINIFVMAEAWCPDAAQNVPPLASLADAVENVCMRCYLGSENPELKQFFTSRGAARIPAVLFCDGGFEPLGIWQERPEPAHRLINEIKDLREGQKETSHLTKKLHQGYQSGQLRIAAAEEMLAIIDSSLAGE